MKHIAVVGTGRVGSALAYTLAFQKWVGKLSLVDIKGEVAEMTKEEIYHGLAMHGLDLEIESFAKASEIKNPDLVVVSAGTARVAGMSRRDLATKNAEVVKGIVEDVLMTNPSARFFVITNPVDAMATLAEQIAGKGKVIGTGTCLESVRFRTILARELNVGLAEIECYVGGEHGESCVPLWSTVKVEGVSLEEYLRLRNAEIDRSLCEEYLRNVSMRVIEATGGTRWGPAGAFLEVIKGVLLNTGKIMAFSLSRKFEGMDVAVHVTVPGLIGMQNSVDLWDSLKEEEKEKTVKAARDIYQTYLRVVEANARGNKD
ncbi:MAG: malate dehydrogenase [Thermoplasmata archaeon]